MDQEQKENIAEYNSKKIWICPELFILDTSKTYGGPGSSIEDMESYTSP